MSRHRLGFKKFICKIEGKEFTGDVKVSPKTNLVVSFTLPGDYDSVLLAELIGDVLSVGAGGELSNTDLVDRAFTWGTHSMEDQWSNLCATGSVTQGIYDVCEYWSTLEL